MVTSLVTQDQYGFMPGRVTQMNLWRSAHVMHSVQEVEAAMALAALDIEKAFDTLDWGYLWKC